MDTFKFSVRAKTVVQILIMSGVWAGRVQKSMAEILLLSARNGVRMPFLEGEKWVMSACRVQKGVWSEAVWEPSYLVCSGSKTNYLSSTRFFV
jgi:hypothetical protein